MSGPRRPAPSRRRRAVRALGLVGVAGACATTACAGWLGTGGGSRWVANRLEDAVESRMRGGRFRIDSLRLGLFRWTVGGIHLVDADARELLAIDRAELRVDLLALLGGAVHVPEASVTGVRVEVRRLDDGAVDWSRVFVAGEGTGPVSTPIDVRIDALAVDDVDLRYRTPDATPLQVADGWLRARFVAHRTTFDLSDLECGVDLVAPAPLPVGLWGGLQWDGVRGAFLRDVELEVGDSHATARGVAGDDLNLAVLVDRLEGADVGALVGTPLAGSWAVALTAKGPPEAFEVVGSLGSRGSDGAVVLAATVDATREAPRWVATAELADFHVEGLVPALAQPVVLAGVARAEGSGASPAQVSADGRWRGRDVVLYGQAVDAVDAAFRIHDGVVDLVPSRVEGVLGTMSVGGTVAWGTGAVDVTVESDLSPARLAALGTPGLDGRGRVRARVTRAPGDAVHVEGTARYAPFVYGPDVAASSVVAPFSVTVQDGRTWGTFDLGVAGVSAFGATAAAATGRQLRLDRAADGRLEVSGTVVTPSVAYGARFETRTATTAFTFRTAGGHRKVDATTRVGPHAILGLPADSGTVVTEVVDDRVRAEVRFYEGERVTLATEARYDLAAAALELPRLRFAPTARATWTAAEPVRMRIVEGGMADAAVHLRSELGEVSVRGALGTAGVLDGRVVVTGFALDHLTELWPDDYDLSGTLALDATVRGPADDPVVDGELAIQRLFANGVVRWLDVDGRFRWDGGTVRPDLALAAVGTPLAHLGGAVPVSGGLAGPAAGLDAAAAWKLAVVPGPWSRLATVLPSLDGTDLPPGVLSACVDGSGPLGDPDVRVAAVSETTTPGFAAPARVELDVVRRGELATFVADVREDLGLRASVAGGGRSRAGEAFASWTGRGPQVDPAAPDRWIDELHADVVLAALPTAGLGQLAGAPALGGDVVGGFVVTGSPTRPWVDGAVNWVDASIGGQPFDGAYLELLPDDAGGYRLAASASLPDGGGIELSGAVPVEVDLGREVADWSTAPLDLTVRGPGVPVSLLGGFDPALRGVAGLVAVAGSVTGPVHAPVPDLTLRGEGLGVLYRPLLLATEDASLEAHVTPDRVTFAARIPTLPARAFTTFDLEPGAEPRIALTGEVALADWAPARYEAEVRLEDGAWVTATDLTKIRTTGALRITGDGTSAVKVKGDLALVQGRVRVEAAGAEAGPLQLGSDLVVVRRAALAAAPPPSPAAPLEIDANVDVDLGRNLQFELAMPFVDQLGELGAAVSRVDLSTRVGGRVKLKAQDGAPTLVGELDLVEGNVRMMRSTFDLQEGHVTFVGGDPYEDAELDVAARMSVSGSSLDLRITGTPVEPVFSLSSEDYPDPTEQMVILVTGSAPDELSADQGAGAALGLLWSSAFSGMRLGSFSIEPSGAVKLGMPVSRALYTSTTWSLTQDPTVNQLSFEADWSLSPHLVLVGALGDRSSTGDLFWEVKF